MRKRSCACLWTKHDTRKLNWDSRTEWFRCVHKPFYPYKQRVDFIWRDNIRNIKKAMDDMKVPSMRCIADTLQLAVLECLLSRCSVTSPKAPTHRPEVQLPYPTTHQPLCCLLSDPFGRKVAFNTLLRHAASSTVACTFCTCTRCNKQVALALKTLD